MLVLQEDRFVAGSKKQGSTAVTQSVGLSADAGKAAGDVISFLPALFYSLTLISLSCPPFLGWHVNLTENNSFVHTDALVNSFISRSS
uniref:Uncharacterized protein n=1 Tax=Parascaris univalens TaxID=6257 RepID=A0A915A3T4_PARUN